MRYVLGLDGGGTRTTVAVADETGHELLRHVGPAGIVNPRHPETSAQTLIRVLREATAAAGLEGAAAALCAGLAGVGNAAEREIVQNALANSGVAERATVRTDGEIALEGAFAGGPGLLIIAGTGSVAYGRGEDGRIERCGGWGMVVGDEGSGYWIGRESLRAALLAEDRRGTPTELLPALLDRLGMRSPREIPPWAGRAEKAEVAALVPTAVGLAEGGDPVAWSILEQAGRDLALHAIALRDRLEPWHHAASVVYLGGVLRNTLVAHLLTRTLAEHPKGFRVVEPTADAVAGALRFARALLPS